MTPRPSVFYAYPSDPKDLGETIEKAGSDITKGGVVDVASWRALSVVGKVIIDEVLKAIDAADVFACDLTYLNSNVLFELGYAMARSKRIWISLNNTIEQAMRDYRSLDRTLGSVGYAAYSNSITLVDEFYRQQPWSDLENTPLRSTMAGSRSVPTVPTMLYLKSRIDTDASVALSHRLQASSVFKNLVIDDPIEIPSETLEWYVQSIQRCDAVVAHLLSNRHVGSAMHNAKCSLVCGLAHGLTKPILMLAHDPFECPIDYRQLLFGHSTADQCRKLITMWLATVEPAAALRWAHIGEYQRERASVDDLRRISVGEAMAENEENQLDDYFVETSAYLEALNGTETVFIGRKGTGKTANLYAVAKNLTQDKRNYVCIIKPVDYEVDGILRMLRQSIDRSERGYLVESLWKFLIYTELVSSVVSDLRTKPAYLGWTPEESDLISFAEKHKDLIMPVFSIRLQSAIESLCDLDAYKPGEEQRAKVSELLHSQILWDLRCLLGSVLQEKNHVCILIDNLDKAWGEKEDVAYLAELLFGLLGVAKRVTEEFRIADSRRRRVNLSLAVFLRSDIFAHIQDFAREKDKLSFTRIDWDDPELLIRVIDERLRYSLDDSVTPKDIWDRFFATTVAGMAVKDYICRSTMPRPRDVIVFVRTAIAEAVNRGHVRVEEDDLLSARLKYSQFAFDSLVAEDNPQTNMLEAILYEFAGSAKIVSRHEVERNIRQSGVSGVTDDMVPRYVDLLCDLGFLGIETSEGKYEFPQDAGRRRVLQVVARKLAERRGSPCEVYCVNTPFYPVLAIS